MRKLAKRIVPFVLVFSIMCSSAVWAEEQSGSVVQYEKTISYSLNCKFSLLNNDKATAKTSWKGKDGYQVRALLYWCENAFSNYKKVGISMDKTSAKVTGSKPGVWKFKSKHSVYNDSTKGTKLLSTYTDW